MATNQINVGISSGDIIGNTNIAIQEAIDILDMTGGGIVHILEGTYTIYDAIHMRPNIILQGQGDKTILYKADSKTSRIIGFLGYGHYDIDVENPDIFNIGEGIYIQDSVAVGFLSTSATITYIKGNTIGIDKMLNCDILEEHNGSANTIYPLISGINVENCCIRNLKIDGNKENNDTINGCRGGGVYLAMANDIQIDKITVANMNGEGISFQQCKNTTISNCILTANTGNGLHPGSGSVGSILNRNICENNGESGIFYCLRVSYSTCTNNILENNNDCGISIGTRDNNILISRNTISDNQNCGIEFRKAPRWLVGSNNLIKNNIFTNNCNSDIKGEICINSPTKDIHICNNIFNTKDSYALSLYAPTQGIHVYKNIIDEKQLIYFVKDEYIKSISYDKANKELLAGHKYIDENSALHLG